MQTQIKKSFFVEQTNVQFVSLFLKKENFSLTLYTTRFRIQIKLQKVENCENRIISATIIHIHRRLKGLSL